MVECDLAKVEVAGSNPVSRSKTIYSVPRSGEGFAFRPASRACSDGVKYKSQIQGAVPKW